jgi:hypothetical protein
MADNPEVSKLSPADLATARRMLQVLDEQIAVLKARHDRCTEDWSLSPLDRQVFMYSSDEEGVINFHSDSSFVAEQLFVYACPRGDRAFLSVEDMSNFGREVTRAQEPQYSQPRDTSTKLDTIWIPPSAWMPTLPAGGSIWSFDAVAMLETEFVVARGGAMRFRFRHSEDGLFRPESPVTFASGSPVAIPSLNYTVTLIGYKVY